jgi:hypothetical protein
LIPAIMEFFLFFLAFMVTNGSFHL